jgi:hypothetical protein
MFSITHTTGAMEPGQLRSLPGLLQELDEADEEHPDVAVSHESGWTIGAYGSGRLVLEHLEDDIEPMHCFVTRDDQLVAATAVALGNASELDNWPWLPGYG